MAAGKRETYAWKWFSSVIPFGEKPVILRLVSSQQLCKRFVDPTAGSPLLCPTQLPPKMCNSDVFRGVGYRQVPEHYIPPR